MPVTGHGRGSVVGAGVALLGFAVLTGLAGGGALVGVDAAGVRASSLLAGPLFTGWTEGVSIALSLPVSLLGAGLGSLWLRRRGLGRWSLAPMGVVLTLLAELALKLAVRHFVEPTYYVPLPTGTTLLFGPFPSGHAIRGGFWCAFLGVILWSRGTRLARLATTGLVVLALLIALSRISLGGHGPSDVVASLALGSAVALVTATPLVDRWRWRAPERSGAQNERAGPLA